jgi:MFS family permease
MIAGRSVFLLGLSLLISWGTTYYLAGVFGERMARDLGWSLSTVHGGFTLALLVTAAISTATGRLIDAYGGRWIMVAGAVIGAAGCAGLALATTIPAHYGAWVLIGMSMRLTLYDAAFAALARIGGPDAGPAMSKVTLLGGLASTVFWPFGHLLAEHFGWRGALFGYALCLLATIPLHLALPSRRWEAPPEHRPAESALPAPASAQRAGRLYALVFALAHFLSSAMAAHLVTLLTGLGLALATAVSIGGLRGIGQVAGRFWQVVAGGRIHPGALTVGAMGIVAAAFALSLAGGASVPFAAIFVALYGAGHGVVTITQGTLPLLIFDHRVYGARTGSLLVPGFIASALAPVVFAVVIETFGVRTAIMICIALALAALLAALRLTRLLR